VPAGGLVPQHARTSRELELDAAGEGVGS
jgi:hypothetical protein